MACVRSFLTYGIGLVDSPVHGLATEVAKPSYRQCYPAVALVKDLESTLLLLGGHSLPLRTPYQTYSVQLFVHTPDQRM